MCLRLLATVRRSAFEAVKGLSLGVVKTGVDPAAGAAIVI
jgi:hypothetical protein